MRGMKRLALLGVPGASRAEPEYIVHIKSLFADSEIVEIWPLHEGGGEIIRGAVHQRNGTYVNIAWGGTKFLDGRPAPYFNGAVGTYGDLYSAALASAFNSVAGTVWSWVKIPDTETWTDGQTRRFIYLAANFNNRVELRRSTRNNRWVGAYVAGGTTSSVEDDYSTLGWYLSLVTWDKAAGETGELIVYRNGAAVSTQTGLGTWSGNLGSSTTLLGSTGKANISHVGYLAYAGLLNRAATPEEVASLYDFFA